MKAKTVWIRLRAGDLRHLGWLVFWPLFGLVFTYLVWKTAVPRSSTIPCAARWTA